MACDDNPIFKEPICLIDSDDDRNLYIKEDVLKEIGLLNQTLHIVTITGLCRTGKSYLLNRLAKIKKAFPLGSSIQSKTKGIWVWCRRHPVHTNDILLLMDTEGLGDIEKGDTNHDNRILALAVLLSSTLIYNILGTLRDNDLQMLSYVTEVCKQIKTSTTAQDKSGSDVDILFLCPIFVLALRDFSLEMTKDGSEITTDSYLNEFCLKTLQGNGEKERSYNETRKCIEKYFKTRKCFTFDRPGNRTILQNLETTAESDLSADFVQDSDTFVKYLHTQNHPKRLDHDHIMTGSSFATLVKAYVEAIRNGRIPNVQNILSATVTIENRKAIEACYELYIREMNILRLPTSDEKSLLDFHETCKKKAIGDFQTKSIRDEDEIYCKEANKKIEEEYNRFKLKNDVESENCCRRALDELNGEMQKKLNENEYLHSGGSKDYESDLNALKEKYNCMNDLGCKKEETLHKFLDRKKIEGEMIKKADIKLTGKEHDLEVKTKEVSSLQNMMKTLQSKAKESEEKLHNMTKQLLETKNKFKEQDERHKANVDRMQKEIEERRKKLEVTETEMKKMREKHKQILEESLAQRKFNEQLLTETNNLKKEIKEKEEENALLKSAEEERSQLQNELSDLKITIRSNDQKYERLRTEKETAEQERHKLMEEKKNLEKKVMKYRKKRKMLYKNVTQY